MSQVVTEKDHACIFLVCHQSHNVKQPPRNMYDLQKCYFFIILGTTAQENDFSPFYQNMTKWNWTDYEGIVLEHMYPFGIDVADTALKMYPMNEMTPEYQFTTLSSDIRVTCGNNIMAIYASQNTKSPVYRYIVTAFPSKPVHILGMPFPSSYSFHMLDALAFFGSLKDYINPLSQSDIDLGSNVRREVLWFTRYGMPYSAFRTGTWKQYPNSTGLLGSVTEVVSDYHGPQCNFWLMKGFFGYSWIN